jgi:hypothetical protein
MKSKYGIPHIFSVLVEEKVTCENMKKPILKGSFSKRI